LAELLPEKVITLKPISFEVFAALIILGDSPLTLVKTTTSLFLP
jgi:hypothetical protein